MKLEPGRLDAGYASFSYIDFGIDDFRTARAYAQDDKYRFGSMDHENLLTFSHNKNRSRDLCMANTITAVSIENAIIDSYLI